MAESMQPPSHESRISRSRIILNSAYSVASYMLGLPVALLLSTFVVHRIGIGPFGVWATLTTILGYGGLLDLGVTTPLIKYVAEYIAVGRRHELNVLLSTAMVFYLAVGTTFLVGMTLASNWILVRVFHAPASDVALRELYMAVIVGFVVSLTFSVLQSLIVGLQRADISARVTLGLYLVNAASTVIALNLGLGVSGLALSWLVTAALTIGVNWLVAKRLFAPLVLNPLLFRFACLKTILRFSTKVQFTTIALAMNDQVDRTLIAYVLGPSMLGYYALASRAATSLRGVSFALMSGIVPAASDLAALGETARLRELYLRGSRYLAIVDFALCVGIAGLARPLVALWLGPGYGRVAVTIMIILGGYAVWLPGHMTDSILYGVGRAEIRMRADIAFLLVHVPLSLLLIWRYGYFGTVVGTSLALTSTRLYYYWAGSRALGVRIVDLLRFSFFQPAVGALLALGAVVTMQLASAQQSLPILLAEGALFGAIYAGYVALFALDRYDRELMRTSILPRARNLLGRLRTPTG
jgi:O-antigen/teichoic acid export membrane protein